MPPQIPVRRGWESTPAMFGRVLFSLVWVVSPVFDTLVITVTDASYELQKKVAHMISDHCDRLLPWITEENYSLSQQTWKNLILGRCVKYFRNSTPLVEDSWEQSWFWMKMAYSAHPHRFFPNKWHSECPSPILFLHIIIWTGVIINSISFSHTCKTSFLTSDSSL